MLFAISEKIRHPRARRGGPILSGALLCAPWHTELKKELKKCKGELKKELTKCKAVTRRMEKLLQRSSGI